MLASVVRGKRFLDTFCFFLFLRFLVHATIPAGLPGLSRNYMQMRTERCAAPTVLFNSPLSFPALAGWANLVTRLRR
jgi:hypothetical protein